MKKLNKLGYIAIGMVLTLIIGVSTPAFAASKDIVKQITAYFTSGGKQISLVVNDTKIEKDSNGKAVTPIIVDGVTYVPVRAAAESLGKEVIWDGANAAVRINDISDNKLKLPTIINDANAKVTSVVGDNGRRTDSIEYTFTLDKNAVGEWEFFNTYLTEDIYNLFDPNKSPIHTRSSVQSTSIYADGTMILRCLDGDKPYLREGFHWTKNYLVDLQYGDKYVNSYAISTINGKTFMVVESKNGDYGRTGKVTMYDVYIKTSNTPAPAPKVKITRDANGVISESMDYEFEMDKEVIGKWEQIDFVNYPEDFNSKDTTKKSYVPTGIHNFYEDGKMTSYGENGQKLGSGEHEWTKGYITDMGSVNTFSAYEIQKLDGKTFMFVQWKNGDYITRGARPLYYVFMKISDTPDPQSTK